MLDNKRINDVTRLFLKKFDKVKSEQKQQKSIANSQYDPNGVANNTMDIDLRDKDQTVVRSDAIAIDVTNIISQTFEKMSNVNEYTFLRECIEASPKFIEDKN